MEGAQQKGIPRQTAGTKTGYRDSTNGEDKEHKAAKGYTTRGTTSRDTGGRGWRRSTEDIASRAGGAGAGGGVKSGGVTQ